MCPHHALNLPLSIYLATHEFMHHNVSKNNVMGGGQGGRKLGNASKVPLDVIVKSRLHGPAVCLSIMLANLISLNFLPYESPMVLKKRPQRETLLE